MIKMYDDLKDKSVKIVFRDGDKVKTLYGIFLDYDDKMFKIKVGEHINYIDRSTLIKVRLEENE